LGANPPVPSALPVKVDASEQLRSKRGPVKVFLMRRLRRLTGSVDRTLTVREREVMRLAAKGLTNRAIAHELKVAEGTIKLHLHNIYRTLVVKSRFALVALVNKKAS
jgi:DNA-binding NarL/FixJ family response regulator